MYFELSLSLLLLFAIPHYGLRSNDLEKTEAIDYIPDKNKENLEDGYFSCDLTKNFCDINCCSDEDCSDTDRDSFDCSRRTFLEETGLFASHICDRVSSEHLEAKALLCLQHANSAYLGEFFREDEPYSHEELPKIIQSRKKQIIGFINQLSNIINDTHSYDYHYGSNIIKSDNKGKAYSVYLPSNIITTSGFCVERPIRFLVNTKSNCLYTLSKQACLSKRVFRLNNFISAKSKVDGGGDKMITINPEVVCLRNGTKYVTFSRNIFHSSGENINAETRSCNGDFRTRLSNKTGICKNVVVSMNYFFYINMTRITSIRAKVLLADIPISVNSFLDLNGGSKTFIKPIDMDKKPYMHLTQSFSVIFINNDKNKSNLTKPGYKIRDILQTNSIIVL